jgi:hypothetical protein
LKPQFPQIGRAFALRDEGLHQASQQEGLKDFHQAPSRACNIVEVRSPPLYFADPTSYLHLRECILPIIVPETGNNFDPWHVFVREEVDDVLLLGFHILDPFFRERNFCPSSFPIIILDAIHFHAMKRKMQRSPLHDSGIEHSAGDGEPGSISMTLKFDAFV